MEMCIMLTASLIVPPFITVVHEGVVNCLLYRALFLLEANETFYHFMVFFPIFVSTL